MGFVTLVGEGGGEREVTISEGTFGVIFADSDGPVRPAATQSVEVESNGNTEQTGTQCGDIERRVTSTDPFKVTVECFITNEQDAVSDSVLTVRDVLYSLQQGATVLIESGFPIDQALQVSNVLVTQDAEVININTSYTDGLSRAYRCTLTFGGEESQ